MTTSGSWAVVALAMILFLLGCGLQDDTNLPGAGAKAEAVGGDISEPDELRSTGAILQVGVKQRFVLRRGDDMHKFIINVPGDGQPHAYAFTVDGLSLKDDLFAPLMVYGWQFGGGDPLSAISACNINRRQPNCGTAYKGLTDAPVNRRYLGTFDQGGEILLAFGQRASVVNVEYDIEVMELEMMTAEPRCVRAQVIVGEASGRSQKSLSVPYLLLPISNPKQFPVVGDRIAAQEHTVLYEDPFYCSWQALDWDCAGHGYWETAMAVLAPSTMMTVVGECRHGATGVFWGYHPIICPVSAGCSSAN